MYKAKKTVLYSHSLLNSYVQCTVLGIKLQKAGLWPLCLILCLQDPISLLNLDERHFSPNDKLYFLGLTRGPQSQVLLGIDAFGLPGTVAPAEVLRLNLPGY